MVLRIHLRTKNHSDGMPWNSLNHVYWLGSDAILNTANYDSLKSKNWSRTMNTQTDKEINKTLDSYSLITFETELDEDMCVEFGDRGTFEPISNGIYIQNLP